MSFRRVKIQLGGAQREVEVIPVNAQQETAATYLLADGTTLSMRTVVVQVYRVPGQFDAEGNPAYVVKSQNIVTAQSPDSLRKPENPNEGVDS